MLIARCSNSSVSAITLLYAAPRQRRYTAFGTGLRCQTLEHPACNRNRAEDSPAPENMIRPPWRWIMGKAYSRDLRDRISDHVSAGHSRREAARRFGVSVSCAIKLVQRVAKTGSAAPARQGRPPGGGQDCAVYGDADPLGGDAAQHQHARTRGEA